MNAIRYPTSTAALRVMRGSAVGIHGRPAGGRRRRNVKCATVGTTTTPKRDSIMYPAVITILRLVGGLMQMDIYLALAEMFEDTIYTPTVLTTLST